MANTHSVYVLSCLCCLGELFLVLGPSSQLLLLPRDPHTGHSPITHCTVRKDHGNFLCMYTVITERYFLWYGFLYSSVEVNCSKVLKLIFKRAPTPGNRAALTHSPPCTSPILSRLRKYCTDCACEEGMQISCYIKMTHMVCAVQSHHSYVHTVDY